MRRLVLAAIVALHVLIAVPVLTQSLGLSVVSASPRGELTTSEDAGEVRIVFSEPMIAIGDAALTGAPPWIAITPAATGSYSWSGTRTLIFTPGPESSVAFATRYLVRVDSSAMSVAGRALAAPYTFSFVTPTVRLLDARWYRKGAPSGSPIVVALRFNQPVRASDVAAHTQLRPMPHDWRAPQFSADERARLSRTDPDGLARFDTKVDATRRAAAGEGAPFDVRAASSWDKDRFRFRWENDGWLQPSANFAVVESIAAPPPGTHLAVTVDARMPSLQGSETHPEHSSSIKLEEAFFVNGLDCAATCDPSTKRSVRVPIDVKTEAFMRALSVRDVSEPPSETPIAAVRPPSFWMSAMSFFDLVTAGFDRQPSGRTWLYAIDASLTAEDGQTLGYPWIGIARNAHERPFAGIGGNVWEAAGGTAIPLDSRNVASARLLVDRVDANALAPLLAAMAGRKEPDMPSVPPRALDLLAAPDIVRSYDVDLRDVLSPRGTGLVWMGVGADPLFPAESGGPNSAKVVQVTNLGVTLKSSPTSTLVFVTRLDSGVPVPQANVTIRVAPNMVAWRGTTDRDGVAIGPAVSTIQLNRSFEEWPLPVIVTAEKDGDLAYVRDDWSGARPSWMFYWPSDELRGAIFTDRGAYRLGDQVHVKALLRRHESGSVRLLARKARIDVTVNDPRGREVDTRQVTLNALSSADWTWSVPAAGALGEYRITVSDPDGSSEVQGTVLVAQFRRPDFRIEATLVSTPSMAGGALHAALDATYLFGASVAGQPAWWSLTGQPTWSVPDAIRQRFPEDRYAAGAAPSGSADFDDLSSDGVLDGRGHLAVEAKSSADVDTAYTYVFEGDVRSAGRQHVAQRATLLVQPAPFYIVVKRPPYFVDTATGASIEIAAAALDGAMTPGVRVDVALLRERWSNTSSGWTMEEVPAGQWRVTTSDHSTVPVRIVAPETGAYIIRATARAASGHRTRTDLSFYALGTDRGSWKADGNVIELVPERKTWQPGESARILVQSPWDRATALLTVEREGIRSHRRFDITSTHDTIDVPITGADVPNVFVSVLLVKGRTPDVVRPDGGDPGQPAYRIGYVELNVDDASKRLAVSVTTDRRDYRPKQEVRVDVSVAAMPGGRQPAEVALWAVDAGLLSLTDYRVPDVVRAIYHRGALGVTTADNRRRLISRRQTTERSTLASVNLDEPKGMFSDAMSAINVSADPDYTLPGGPQPRTDFRPLVFWIGSAKVGSDGHAHVTATLPDSLTTYRVLAVAGDAASRFGWADHEILVAKPLALVPEFPRFLSRGDHATFSALVTNATSSGGDAVVSVRSLTPAVLTFGGAGSTTLRVAQGATTPVSFDATAHGVGMARVQMVVTLGGESDAFETTLPVTIPSRMETVAAYGDTASRALERVALPPGLVPDVGGLRVDLASTALVGLGESARYLDEYPYECAEQKTSRALALLLTSDLGGAFSLSKATPAESRAKASELLHQVFGDQCPDGGFALWSGMCRSTSAYLTAYVLHTLSVAATLKTTVDEYSIDRALDYLEASLRESPPEAQWWPAWAASQAYAVKVLAESNRHPLADVTRLYGTVDRLPVFAMSYLADALAATGDRGSRYQAVVQRMTNALRVEADRAHVEEIDDASLIWLWNTNVRATAVVLEGLARRKDEATLVAPLVRWLVGAQTNGRWGTTHENATALEALVNYYRTYESDVPKMTASVTLGGKRVGSATFKGRSTTAQSVDVSMAEVVRQVSSAEATDLIVEPAGKGRLFYTSRLRYLAPEPPQAVDRGIRVERTYAKVMAKEVAAAGTEFAADDLVRVTLTVTMAREGRYIALSDPMPAGFEPVDANLSTTASDLARAASVNDSDSSGLSWWRRGGFDHVEKHDDRVVVFATRLSAGTHEFSYLARATTPGSFTTAGAQAEAMYAPEVKGRSTAGTIHVR